MAGLLARISSLKYRGSTEKEILETVMLTLQK